MGSLQVRTWLGVVENLAVEILLGTTCIYQYIKGMFAIDENFVSRHSALIPISGRNRKLYRISSIISHRASRLKAIEPAAI